MVVACTGKSDTAAHDFEPDEGIWIQTKASNTIEDSCTFTSSSSEQPSIEEETFGMFISMSGPQRFRIYSLEENERQSPFFFACVLDHRQFSCYPFQAEQSFHEESDIIVQTEQLLSGTFHSTTSASVTSRIEIKCSGDECAALYAWGVELPCSITSTFSVALSP